MSALAVGAWRTATPLALLLIGYLLRSAIAHEREKRLIAEKEVTQEKLLTAKGEIAYLQGLAGVRDISRHPSVPGPRARPVLRVVEDKPATSILDRLS